MGQALRDTYATMTLPADVMGCPVYTDLISLGAQEYTVVTLGRFDGVHRGHQALLRETVELACSSTEGRAIAITLWPPPEWVLRVHDPRGLLTTLIDRLALMASTGVDGLVVLTFDQNFSQQSPREFLTRLRDELGMGVFMTGPNARIGKDGTGNPAVLRSLSSDLKVDYREIGWHGRPQLNRSSAIRTALVQGNIGLVNEGLGRTYSMAGVVVRGEGEGRKIGFPTANVTYPTWLQIPGDGVYAGVAMIDEGPSLRRAAISVGARPTYGGAERVVEAHLSDYDDDLYGHDLRLFFVNRIRGQVAFDSVDDLGEEIERDVDRVRLQACPPLHELAPFVDG